MITTVVGGYPKIIEDQKWRKALWKVDKGELSREDLEKVAEEVTQAAIREQEELGLDLVCDGMIRADDEITFVARSLEGFKITGLVRFFDTNVLYREPVAVGPVRWRESALLPYFEKAQRAAKNPLKVILTGPYTLIRHARAEWEGYRENQESLFLDAAKALNAEILALEKAGARHFHVNEPSLVQHHEDLPLFQKLMAILFQGVQREKTLYFSFGKISPLLSRLKELPVDTLGIDFTYDPEALQSIQREGWDGKKLLAGIVDARNTKLEEEKEFFSILSALAKKVGSERLEIAPSASLEFLPLDRCRLKVKRMAGLVKKYAN